MLTNSRWTGRLTNWFKSLQEKNLHKFIIFNKGVEFAQIIISCLIKVLNFAEGHTVIFKEDKSIKNMKKRPKAYIECNLLQSKKNTKALFISSFTISYHFPSTFINLHQFLTIFTLLLITFYHLSPTFTNF